jgi:hypothetical protein
MIFMFISTLLMKTVAIFALTFLFIYKAKMNPGSICGLFVYIAFVVVPTSYSMFYGSKVKNSSKEIGVYVGKVANDCDNDVLQIKVSFTLYSFINF